MIESVSDGVASSHSLSERERESTTQTLSPSLNPMLHELCIYLHTYI